jgi:hypothetical protein
MPSDSTLAPNTLKLTKPPKPHLLGTLGPMVSGRTPRPSEASKTITAPSPCKNPSDDLAPGHVLLTESGSIADRRTQTYTESPHALLLAAASFQHACPDQANSTARAHEQTLNLK